MLRPPQQNNRLFPMSCPEVIQTSRRRTGAARLELLSVAVEAQGSSNRVRWNNPDNQHKGEFKSAALPTVADDQICRDFTASVTLTVGPACSGDNLPDFGDDGEVREIGS